MQFIRKVYAILTLQLLLTTALSSISFFSDSYKNWIQSNQWMMWVSMFGAIGFMLLTYWKRKSYVSTTSGTHAAHISILTAHVAHEPRIPHGLHRT
jgi:FtsH-binding integral membrane protein